VGTVSASAVLDLGEILNIAAKTKTWHIQSGLVAQSEEVKY
jgi:hypothetical protein